MQISAQCTLHIIYAWIVYILITRTSLSKFCTDLYIQYKNKERFG